MLPWEQKYKLKFKLHIMKKIILTTVILSAVLISCKETTNKEVSTSPVETLETTHEVDRGNEMVLNNAWVNEIELDNGKKWEANLETNEGVDKMMALINGTHPKTVEEFHQLASKLNDDKNVVVKKCNMEGPSHDNLHVFLHPLIEKIDALGKVSTIEKGVEISESIKENLDAYKNYFK